MKLRNLQLLLNDAASSCPANGIITHCPKTSNSAQKFTYAQLLRQSSIYAAVLRRIRGYQARKPVLIYLQDELEVLLWFWATLFANLIPVMVPRMSNIDEQRRRYISSLDILLDRPTWISSSEVRFEFPADLDLNLLHPDSISSWPKGLPSEADNPTLGPYFGARAEEDAMYMLTSGSTGSPKVVPLSHHQLLISIHGKLSMREHPGKNPFLNWISLDHVASIAEIHLTAMLHHVDQVLMKAIDVISDPLLFIKLLSDYKVSRTFAPNFFLAKLVQSVHTQAAILAEHDINLQHLMWLGSGGEANDVKVGADISEFMVQHGARPDVLVPGFGMTETCAGAIYNMNCPAYDIVRGNQYTALGKCIPGIEMRIVAQPTDDLTIESLIDTPGDLEVRGDVVFRGYHQNVSASAEAFTEDGWFRTGDQALIDANGILHLTGRIKDTVIINGNNLFLQDIENVVSRALPDQLSRVICFPFRPLAAPTESICMLYVLGKEQYSFANMVKFHGMINHVVMMHTGAVPQVIALSEDFNLQVSSLGKVSRNKLRKWYQEGVFNEAIENQRVVLGEQRIQSTGGDMDENVNTLLADIHSVLNLPWGTIGPDVAIFEVGMTSIDIFRLKKFVEQRLQIDIPLTVILSNPTARAMAPALENFSRGPETDYDPVVALRREGEHAPLWLVHPGVGEVLVFLGLSRCITDRPIYALRARGFDGQPHFVSISETVSTYCDAIKKQQPEGPYAIAGYSYGSMLAFEICKRFEANGANEVRFLGSFNLPPHIKHRMEQMNWTQCIFHLCFFLDLLSQEEVDEISPSLCQRPNDEVFDHIFQYAHKDRLRTLSLESAGLKRWAQIAYRLQNMAVDYEPSGTVSSIDIFHAEPLKVAASSRVEWVDRHLRKWSDFTESEPRLHEVQGAHYTMLAPEYVDSFAETLRKALADRNV